MEGSLYKLASLGLQVATNDTKGKLMHHKFVVIDDRVLMNGSLNFTTQAVSRNDENLVVTRSRRIVAAFRNKFDALWAEYCGNQIEQGLAQQISSKEQADQLNRRQRKEQMKNDEKYSRMLEEQER